MLTRVDCYADGYAAEMYYGGDENLSATLSPGRSTSGFVYFTVPVGAQTVEIEYEVNAFTEEKIKFLYEGEQRSEYVPKVDQGASENALAVGSVFETNSLRIHYLSVEPYTSDNTFIQPRDGYEFVSCAFEVENIGEGDELVTSYSFDCYADGVACEGVYYRDDDLNANLSPGRKGNGTVTFEIPTDAKTVEVEYLDNYWIGDRIVFSVK